MLRKASHLAAFGSFMIAILAAASASAAPDAHAVADALVAAFGASGKAVASYGDAVATGDTITITGFKAVQPKAKGRDLDKFEREQSGFFERVRNVYLERAAREPARFRGVDAARPIAEVRSDLTRLIEAL